MKSINLKTWEAQAIQDNRKSVIRQVINHFGNDMHYGKLLCDWALSEKPYIKDGVLCWELQTDVDDSKLFKIKLPYCKGDILYGRETWLKADDGFHYKTDIKVPSESETLRIAYGYKWRPSIHMPIEAARIFLRVTDVRVERLQDITEEQAVTEGFYKGYSSTNTSSVAVTARQAFMWKWQSIYDRGPNPWISNPWVRVTEFERISKEEAMGGKF
jgi:hypothetical protein